MQEDNSVLTPEIYANRVGLRILDEAMVVKVLLAVDQFNQPQVWALRRTKREIEIEESWIVTTGGNSYMFKDSGLFGYTENPENINENTFPNLYEAVAAFYSFYVKQ